jgi:hypothetical protein
VHWAEAATAAAAADIDNLMDERRRAGPGLQQQGRVQQGLAGAAAAAAAARGRSSSGL